VIYIGSLSKLLVPALRIGYIVAPAKVIDSLAQEVMLMDNMGNVLTEDATAELIRTGEVRRMARKATQIYARRRRTFAQTLTEGIGDLAEFAMPDGGLAFWHKFHDQGLLDRIDARAPAQQLWVAPSRSFVAQTNVPRGLRVGFASLSEREAKEAIRRLRLAALG
jgi:GntR family transcriptional regulator/MocR family aminotransferase